MPSLRLDSSWRQSNAPLLPLSAAELVAMVDGNGVVDSASLGYDVPSNHHHLPSFALFLRAFLHLLKVDMQKQTLIMEVPKQHIMRVLI